MSRLRIDLTYPQGITTGGLRRVGGLTPRDRYHAVSDRVHSKTPARSALARDPHRRRLRRQRLELLPSAFGAVFDLVLQDDRPYPQRGQTRSCQRRRGITPG